MSQYFGFESLFKSVQPVLKEKHEVIVVLVHWFLVREGFQCLGVGTERDLLPSDLPSELLPEGWNNNTQTYYMRYWNPVSKKILVLDVTIASPKEVHINIVGDPETVVDGIALDFDLYLGDYDLSQTTKVKIPQIMPRVDEVIHNLQKHFEVLVPKESVDIDQPRPSAQKPETPRPRTPLTEPSYSFIPRPINPFNGVGRGDLDPFGIGCGMLGIPPRPRSDPTGPVPDSGFDHFPPPGRRPFPH